MDTEDPEIIDLETLKDTPILSTRDRQLSVPLTEEELSDRVDQQSEMWATMRDLKEEEDDRRKVFNRQHKSREDEFDRGQRIVKAKAEDRQVEVVTYAILDGPPDGNVALTVRADTGEVRDRRALTPREIDELSQQALPLPPAADDELPPEPDPMPTGARDLAKVIADGGADHALDALKADTRPTVEKAVAARREALLAGDMAEAEL